MEPPIFLKKADFQSALGTADFPEEGGLKVRPPRDTESLLVKTTFAPGCVPLPETTFDLIITLWASPYLGDIQHYHPSGDLTPSENDITITKQLAQAGRIMGIELVDHLIIGEGGFVSLKKKRVL